MSYQLKFQQPLLIIWTKWTAGKGVSKFHRRVWTSSIMKGGALSYPPRKEASDSAWSGKTASMHKSGKRDSLNTFWIFTPEFPPCFQLADIIFLSFLAVQHYSRAFRRLCQIFSTLGIITRRLWNHRRNLRWRSRHR